MAPNVVALVAAVLGLAGVVMSALLLTTTEFVEVFIAKDSESLSENRIGYLGVYQAGFTPNEETDSSLLEGANLATVVDDVVSLNIEPFTSKTTEFKLLFPSQTKFFDEVNPLKAVLEGGVAQAQLAVDAGIPTADVALAQAQGNLDAAFPEFEDCNTYYDGLYTVHTNLWTAAQPTIEDAVFGGIIEEVGDMLIAPWFAGNVTGGMVQFLFTVIDTIFETNTLPFTTENTIATIDTALTAQAGINLVTLLNDPALATSLGSTVAGVMGRVGTVVISGCNTALTVQQCVGLAFADDIVRSGKPFSDGLSADFNEVFVNVPSAGPMFAAALAPLYSAFATAAVTVSAEAAPLALGIQGNILVVSTVFTGNISSPLYPAPEISTPNPLILTADSLDAAIAEIKTGLITSKDIEFDVSFPLCELLQASGLYTFGALPGQCTFSAFIDEAAALENADVLSFARLYQGCRAAIAASPVQDTALCFSSFFASALLDATFQGALADTELTGADRVFAQAELNCEDDEKDMAAIEQAQVLAPAGAAVIGVGALVGVAAAFLNNKIVAGVAGGVSLIGAVLILVALLGVYQAPIYESVGGDPVQFAPTYVSGVTVTYGLCAIGLGAVSGIAFIVSIFTMKAPAAALEEVGAKKNVSI